MNINIFFGMPKPPYEEVDETYTNVVREVLAKHKIPCGKEIEKAIDLILPLMGWTIEEYVAEYNRRN